MILLSVFAIFFWVSFTTWIKLQIWNKCSKICAILRRWESLKNSYEISNETKNFWWNLINVITSSSSVRLSNACFIKFKLEKNKLKSSRLYCRDIHYFEKIVFERFETNNKTWKKLKNVINLFFEMFNIFKLLLSLNFKDYNYCCKLFVNSLFVKALKIFFC